MKKAVHRTDGSNQIGMGHVQRSLAFADALYDLKLVDSTFVVKSSESRVSNLIKSRGYSLVELPPQLSHTEDAHLTRELAKDGRANLIVTDIGHSAILGDGASLETYHRSLKSSAFTICFAGGDAQRIPCDLVVRPYVGLEDLSAGDPGYHQRLLIGPRFFVFSRPFRQQAGKGRTIRPTANRILVSMGGGDDLCLTAKVAEALCLLTDQCRLSAQLILGPACSQALEAEVYQSVRDFGGDYEVVMGVDDMANRLVWADLAIIGDGLTKYEAAVTGTPSIMLSRPDSPIQLNRRFVEQGSTIHVGDGTMVETETLSNHVEVILGDFAQRLSMSECGQRFLDGKGCERIIESIPDEVLHG